MTDFAVCSWPTQQVNEALVSLAQTAGVGAHAAESTQQAPANLSRERFGSWLKRRHVWWALRRCLSR